MNVHEILGSDRPLDMQQSVTFLDRSGSEINFFQFFTIVKRHFFGHFTGNLQPVAESANDGSTTGYLGDPLPNFRLLHDSMKQ